MKKIISILTISLSLSMVNAQSIPLAKNKTNQSKVLLENTSQAKTKTGTYFGSGLLIGLGSGLLVKVIKNASDTNSEWYYGIGKTMLISGGIGAIVGLLIPKYKTLDIETNNKNTSFKISPLDLHAKITF